jgi:hypothetical protein
MNPHTACRSWSTASLAEASLALTSGSVTSANAPISANVAIERLVVVRPKDDSDRHPTGLG